MYVVGIYCGYHMICCVCILWEPLYILWVYVVGDTVYVACISCVYHSICCGYMLWLTLTLCCVGVFIGAHDGDHKDDESDDDESADDFDDESDDDESAEDFDDESDDDEADENFDGQSADDESADEQHDQVDVLAITRRHAGFGISRSCVSTPEVRLGEVEGIPRNVAEIQRLWHEHAARASGLFPLSLWRVLSAVKLESKQTQTKVLQACSSILSRSERKKWPRSRRQVDERLNKRLGSFHTRVMRSIFVDLGHHNVPAVQKPIEFTFIDPVFAWSVCAQKLSQTHELHFKYKKLTHPCTGERLYGASVAHGDIMREACRKCSPPQSAPALIGLSYDSGNASKRRSYTPIIVSVKNTDYCGMNSCVCIAYMPEIDCGASVKQEILKDIMHDLRQACIGAIVDVIEACGQHGFRCMLSEKSQVDGSR